MLIIINRIIISWPKFNQIYLPILCFFFNSSVQCELISTFLETNLTITSLNWLRNLNTQLRFGKFHLRMWFMKHDAEIINSG